MIKPKNEVPSYLIDDALVKIERESDMNRRTFVKGGVALAAMLAMGGAMGTYAWFTGREVKENETSIAENLEIEVVEPNFPSSGIVENVVPGAVIPKDPSVVNKSDVLNGYLFTEIRVPIAEVLVEGSEVAERLPLFSFEPNEGWKLLQEFEDGDEKVFRYGWTEVVEHGGQTGSVFDTVTFVNLTGSAQGLDVGEQLVKVIGYGIQDAEAFEGDVAKAWNAYKLQNGITDGVGNKVSAALIAGAAGNKLQFVSGTPSVGDVLDTGEVIEVVEDVEHLPAGDRSPLVSPENIGSVTVVEDVVATKPENTVNWFKDMDSVTAMDLSGLDTSEVTDKTGMFDGTVSLESIKVGETTNLVGVIPSGFTKVNNVYTREIEAQAVLCDGGYLYLIKRAPVRMGSRFNGKLVSAVTRNIEGETLDKTDGDAINLVTQDIISCEVLDTIKPVNLKCMGFQKNAITTFDIAKLDCSRVVDFQFSGHFHNMSVLDLSCWDTSNCRSVIINLDGSYALRRLDVSGISLESCTGEAELLVGGCEKLTTIYCNADFSEHTAWSETWPRKPFDGCTVLVGGEGTTYKQPFDAPMDQVEAAALRVYARPDKKSEGKPGYFTMK